MKNKTLKLVAALLVASIVGPLAFAATNYIGQVIQKVDLDELNGVDISTGNGTADAGTQRVTIASDNDPIPVSPASSFTVSNTTFQVTGLDGGPVLAVVGGTLSVSGSTLAVTGLNGGPIFTQAVTTTTVNIVASTVPVTGLNGGPVAVAIASSVTLTNTTMSVTGLNNGPVVTISTNVGTPVVYTSSVGVTSVTILPANPNRVGVECESSCDNNKEVFMNFGAAASTTNKPLEVCSSWQPPSGVRFTSSITAIGVTGTQTVICVEY